MNANFIKLLTLTLLVLVTSCSAPKDNKTLLAEAKTSIEISKYSEAAINLKNIIQSDPKHAEARQLLGKIYLKVDNLAGAEKEFTKALEIAPDNEAAKLLLAKTYLLISKFTNLTETLAEPQFTNTDDQIYALLLLGQANLSLGNIEKAKENIQEANDLSSTSQHSVLGRAFIAVYDNSHDNALALVDALLSRNNKFEEAWLLKGSILSNQGEFKAAANAYSEYYKLKPANIGIRTIIAHNYVRAGEYDLAKPHIEDLRKINENHPTVNTLAAQVKYAEGDYESAKDLANSVVNATNNGLANMISGLSSFQLKNYQQAYSSLNAISDNLPKEHKVHKILAVLQVKLGYTEAFENSLSNFTNNPEDSDIYANLGMEFIQQGDKDAALEMFEKANSLSPNNANIKAQLGALKLNNSDNSGLIELSSAIEINPNFKAANIALAMAHLKSGKLEKATAIANSWIKSNPKSSAALILRGNIALQANENDKAMQYFIQASETNPTDIIPLFNLAVLHANQLKFDKSNSSLDKLYALDLEYPYAYRLAISNAIELDEEEKLKNKLMSFIKNNADVIWPKIILARRFMIEKNHIQALAILQNNIDYATAPSVYFQTLANMLLETRNTNELIAMHKSWQRAQPFNEMAYFQEAAYQEKLKDYNGALSAIKRGLLKPELKNNFKLQSLEAYYLLKTNQTELASQKVNLLASNEPGHPLLTSIQGQIALSRKQFNNASELLKRSYLANTKESVGVMLIAAYKGSKNIKEAISFLTEEQYTFENSQVYSKLLAEMYIADEPKKAISNYQKVLAKTPNDVVTLNNLAWVYYENQQFDNALKYAEQAIKIAPKHPQALDTYGLALMKNNKLTQAIATLELAYSLDSENSEIKAHLAEAYIANSQQEKADLLLK
jgi:putative PEP-CTERM system TPR-repeat lipoprotein